MSVRSATQFLFLLALILAAIIFFHHAPLSVKNNTEHFIGQYQGILTSIGTLVLVGFLTLLATKIANEAASRRDFSNRKLAAELKIAEFRQAWISEIRDDLAELAAITVNLPISREDTRRANVCIARIRLRLNVDEVAAQELLLAMNRLFKTTHEDAGEHQTAFVSQGQLYLKKEWDRLKTDLKKITTQGLEP